jgi:hypothetical protein
MDLRTWSIRGNAASQKLLGFDELKRCFGGDEDPSWWAKRAVPHKVRASRWSINQMNEQFLLHKNLEHQSVLHGISSARSLNLAFHNHQDGPASANHQPMWLRTTNTTKVHFFEALFDCSSEDKPKRFTSSTTADHHTLVTNLHWPEVSDNPEILTRT